MIPIRFSDEWQRGVRDSGLWLEPAFWRDQDYLARSPWPAQEIDAAFDALLQLYPTKVARRIFRSEPKLAQRLMDYWAPHISPLLELGFEAHAAAPWQHRKLLQRLRSGEQFEGARFELTLLAAFKRARIDCSFEPHDGTQGASNPDFKLVLDGTPLFIDAKYAQMSRRREEEERWFRSISLNLFLEPLDPYPLFKIELTEKFEQLQGSDEGRSWLRGNIHDIEKKVRSKVEELAKAVSFPVEGGIDSPAGTIVKVWVDDLAGPGRASSVTGLAPNTDLESIRVARNFLEKGASQLPAGQAGALIIDIGKDALVDRVEQEVRRWLAVEGVAYPWFAGVVLLAPEFARRGRWIQPVWRDAAPPAVQDTGWCERFADALNWHTQCVADWERQRETAPLP
jgi:hypothetical protein